MTTVKQKKRAIIQLIYDCVSLSADKRSCRIYKEDLQNLHVSFLDAIRILEDIERSGAIKLSFVHEYSSRILEDLLDKNTPLVRTSSDCRDITIEDVALFECLCGRFNILRSKEVETSKDGQIKPLPYPLPKGTDWQHITIKFIDGENVAVSVKSFRWEVSFKEMGFQDNKAKPRRPNTQWKVLHRLALQSELRWSDKDASSKVKKHKQLLSQGLRKYFGISSDPFEAYRNNKSYKLKLYVLDESTNEESSNFGESDDLTIDQELKQMGLR